MSPDSTSPGLKMKFRRMQRVSVIEKMKPKIRAYLSCWSHCFIGVTPFTVDFFVNEILKKLKLEIKIILITAQVELPILYKNDLTDYVLNHDNIIHWYSHNPIYIPSNKYSPFPYGIQTEKVKHIHDIFKLMAKEKLIK